jgi:hypothetical protein
LKAQEEAAAQNSVQASQSDAQPDLVETPEAKSDDQPQPEKPVEKKPRRPRQPRKPRAPKAAAEQPKAEAPDAPAPDSGAAPEAAE